MWKHLAVSTEARHVNVSVAPTPLLSVCSTEMDTYVHGKIGTRMFRVSLCSGRPKQSIRMSRNIECIIVVYCKVENYMVIKVCDLPLHTTLYQFHMHRAKCTSQTQNSIK